MPTRTLWRSPCSVRVPSGTASSSSARHLHVLSWDVDLVRPQHMRVEDRLREGHQARMRDPSSVVTGLDLAQLVGAHPFERDLVRGRVVLDRDLRGHPAHRMHLATVARVDEQLHVSGEKALVHRHLRAIGQNRCRIGRTFLDEREDVIPATAVEAGRVLAQLVEKLVHLECGRQRLDEARRFDGSPRDPKSATVRAETRRSTGAPRGSSPSSAGRSRDPCRGRLAPWRCGRRRGRSRRAHPAPDGRRRSGAARPGAIPRGRTNRTATRSLSAYRLPVSGATIEIVRRTASIRLS